MDDLLFWFVWTVAVVAAFGWFQAVRTSRARPQPRDAQGRFRKAS